MMFDYKKQIDKFRQYLIDDGKAITTVNSYVSDVEMFYEWLVIKDTFVDEMLKRFFVTSYRKYLVEKEYSVNTVNKKINSINAYNVYLISISKMTDMVVSKKDKLSIATGSEQEVSVFSEAEIERILFYIQDPIKVRTRDNLTIVFFFYSNLSSAFALIF